MLYYHATSEDRAMQIVYDGEIKTSIEGIVYLADSYENALKFTILRGYDPIIVFEIEVPDESLIEEQFDHNPRFFQCKSWGYPENIDLSYVKNIYKYCKQDLSE